MPDSAPQADDDHAVTDEALREERDRLQNEIRRLKLSITAIQQAVAVAEDRERRALASREQADKAVADARAEADRLRSAQGLEQEWRARLEDLSKTVEEMSHRQAADILAVVEQRAEELSRSLGALEARTRGLAQLTSALADDFAALRREAWARSGSGDDGDAIDPESTKRPRALGTLLDDSADGR